MVNSAKTIFDLMKMSFMDIWDITDKKQFILAMSGWILRKCDYGTRLSALTDEEKVVFIIVSFQGEVNDGDFEQFLSNSSGEFAGELLSSLSAIGAERTARMYRDVLERMPRDIPKDPIRRGKLIKEALTEDVLKAFSSSDDGFYKKPDDLEELLYQYIMDNRHCFT
jgi:hypothetical protein